ncbi:MAG: hypothetical protein ABJK64_20230 [Paraglaciecola sp.]|uniref:hypothetical protein n=1 Tax=Paraglaciecola sp. TaxID=1920173 RepID=UPI003297B987
MVDKVIYLKAIIPDNSCGSIASTFNRLYSSIGETVSKTIIYEKLKTHTYQVKYKRRTIKTRKPKATAINQTWGIDLTTVTINTSKLVNASLKLLSRINSLKENRP